MRPGWLTKLQLSALGRVRHTRLQRAESFGVLTMTTIHRSSLRPFAAALLVGTVVRECRPFETEAQQGAGAALDAALGGAHRSAANKARDRYRHPKETLEFFGFRPEMTVVEIWPGGGWYTEILAPLLRDRGKLYAALYGSNPPFPYQSREMESFRAKLASAPADLRQSHASRALGLSRTSSRSRHRVPSISS